MSGDIWVDDDPTLELPVVPVQPHAPVQRNYPLPNPTTVQAVRAVSIDIRRGLGAFLRAAWIPLKFLLKAVGMVLFVALMLCVAIIPYLDPDPNGFRKN